MNVPQPTGNSSLNKLPDAISNTIHGVSEGVSTAYNTVADRINTATTYVGDTINSFSSKSAVDGSNEFLQSNTILAKFAFLIIVLVGFLFLVNLGMSLIGYFSKPLSNVFLISGTANGANEFTIPQDPKNKDSKIISRSNNELTGIEFTWCTWIYINDVPNPETGHRYLHIFNKGNAEYNEDTGIATVDNGPGLYFDTSGNQLTVIMNTVSAQNPYQLVEVPGIPLRKWFHCAIRMENKVLDVYVNGIIVSRLIMQDVPKQNYMDVHICKNGGFNGNLADLQYFNRALSVFELNNIVVWGRNTSAASGSSASDATGYPYYLSNLWYSTKY
jgi:hypothetical protein